ncbi:MAG: J domain-containing protein [Cyanobium sp.]
MQRNTQQLRRSFRSDAATEPGIASVPTIPMDLLRQAQAEARQHWLGLYGHAPNDAVLEAAMLWLARDVWPQCDQCEGRSFTWSAACRAMAELVRDWEDGPPDFERVIVMAGVLEDPFSIATLPVRIPTLIRSFTQRFRHRRRSTSFAMLEQTMTLQGALKTLQVHSNPDQGITLGQIREAYREMALQHHPDSGGSVEAMRRIHEAYQLLKELYRQRQAAD